MAAPRGKFLQAAVVLIAAVLLFKYGIRPPMPFSVFSLYMAVTLMAVLVYVSSDSDSWRAFVAPVWATLTDPGRRPVRLFLGVVIPILIGYYAYSQAAARAEAPLELRAVHPAPPATISFRGKEINLQHADTPIRQDIKQNPANREKHLAAGAATYIRNCVYCHGDLLDGQGHFAHGFNPQPADFAGPNTIAQLSEGFVFWRIAKGGPGLPKESTPWNSAMPSWEDRLTEEQIWQVIYFLYEYTGHPPRVMESHAAWRPDPGAASGLLMAGASGLGPREAAAQSGDVALGKQVYEKRCVGCHGADGKGDGPAAELLVPRPRDFTAGKYKIRSVAGPLASDQDLLRIVTEGMPGTSMPSWRSLPDRERTAVVAYVKTFAESYKGAKIEPVAVPKEVSSSEASLRRGKKMFDAFECVKCHGQAGRGDPAPGSDLKDDWGHPIRPANLHHPWNFRGGSERRDVVMRLLTGVAGTPMPAIADSVEDYRKSDEKDADVKDASLWDLANYVRSLGPEHLSWAPLLSVSLVTGEVPSDPNAEFWTKRPGADFPLVGQVIADPRNFNPTVDMVTVRAVYTDREAVFHLTWDDPTASDPTKGAPKPDMIAIQLPTGEGAGDRPYFLMGDGSHPVYLLTWRAGSEVGEATATGVGKVTPQAGEAVQAKGQAVYDAGQYRAVIRRPLKTADGPDFVFRAGEFFPVALWAWDGSEGDDGPKAAVSTWYYARLEPPTSKRRFVVPPVLALAAGAAELGLARWARRRREAA
ncbi:MAG TPA: c-type cytochrome [Methylomirabilota bacterium]|jgi:DMSO reductase family type II enzyme heme b subunit